MPAQKPKWQTEMKRVLDEFEELVREAFTDGYNRGQSLERNRQAARERNGGKDPDYHQCHFCGEWVANGYSHNNKRHWLSDCRPDLVEHEPGPSCTWFYLLDYGPAKHYCYAFQDREGSSPWPWTDKHEHFDEDGPM